MQESFIPFHKPSIGIEECEAVQRVLTSGWLTTGPVSQQFEREFASYIGCKYALAVNSCTAALHLALDAANIQKQDEVILPAYTFTATGEVITYLGARPVLCDSISAGFNLDPEDVNRRITPRTRAIIAVHIAGEACDLDALRVLASRYELHLIEDAAHILPGSYEGERVGSRSEMAAYSFYATKTITTGDGGMFLTASEELFRRAALMRLHGISGDAWKRYSREGSWFYDVIEAGFKMNLPDVLAAIGLAQLRKADLFHRRRCEIAAAYLRAFAQLDELELPPTTDRDAHSWHLFILRIRPELLRITRNDFIEALKKAGVGTSVHFIPLHLHTYYRDRLGYRAGDFPRAEDAYSRAISLPIYPEMTMQEVERVAAAVTNVVATNRRVVLAGAA